jgi:rsbT co-antagonist protein RsbR
VFDAYEPAANAIAITVAVGFVQERERVIREQQEAIRELSTPVLQVRERLLILPIIGLIDPHRARQLTEQLLRGIRANRARVVVIDITGVAAMDANVANLLVLTVESARLLGARVIVTGLSPEIAQTLVNIGVDLGKMNTVGDLQGGIEEAERVLGYRVVPIPIPEPKPV